MTTTAGRLPGPYADRSPANERFKEHFNTLFWESLTAAVLIHFVVIMAWPSMGVTDVSYAAAELAAVELPPEIEIPPAPEAIPRPAIPVVSEAALDEEITIAPTTFEANPIENLPAPPAAGYGDAELAAAPTFTPFTVAPELKNREEVRTALLRFYPRLLKDAGIGGQVLLWFFIDQEGRVVKTQLKESSGYDVLDAAAAQVAQVMEFSPAYNRDKRVPVWVKLPVIFEVM